MNNFILVTIINIGLFALVAWANRYNTKIDRQERAFKQHRWSDGTFAKCKTHSDLMKEIYE